MMSVNEVDMRKARRLKRRATTKERNISFCYEENENALRNILGEALFYFLNDHRYEPRFKLCSISRDQGKTWTNENINVAVTDPNM
ncbi:hypothetical protein [Paenibacillus macquariensis]|uniref:Uncharacterized protein n=1 Tax=Paenibacillus macquariensis TaxID=948756 RepID=A0ABY1KGJ1_9BACL|nr:hypothetical protein [Paenibacillus macquariensis]OAB33107.1 hypothetical protein PMSM_16285 [Paenibacillus macquariensis subsp. macquariensis]SIR70591.1 hypothetical protein SAMN05421578_1386 [Paenibacillus macquariensis]